ncbi:uncharacterized protein LOC118226029 [Anguilla anguilla]|uniref:uncharacterized protein LOC118226029 n=1 Tax=Anguilla anguilla TaxID=7936 RepID=UPI0015B116B8|nr:uncharacterized protein LOC118226029 [Anguilla anguilla]
MKGFYKAKIQELRKRLAACHACAPDEEELERKHVHLEEKISQSERTTETVLKRNSEVCTELLETERQAQGLRLQVTALTRRGQQQQSEIRRLNKILSEALVEERESRTQVELLRHQVWLHEKDFHKERAERRQLCERNVELERRLETLNAEMQKARAQVTRTFVCTPKPRSHAPCGCRQGDGLPAIAGRNGPLRVPPAHAVRLPSFPHSPHHHATPETQPEPSRCTAPPGERAGLTQAVPPCRRTLRQEAGGPSLKLSLA